MDRLLTGLGWASAALLAVAVAVAWWEHRKRMLSLRRELAWSENSRFALEQHVREVDVRLQVMSAALESHHEAVAATRERQESKEVAAQTLQRLGTATQPGPAPAGASAADTPPPARPSDWPDTLPMAMTPQPGFDPTRPADLQRH